MRGSGVVESTSEMYARLLTYAHAFERHPRFKKKMALDECEDRNSYELSRSRRCGNETFDSNATGNPYRPWKDLWHPLKTHLASANQARQCYDNSLFKIHRKNVIDALKEKNECISHAAKTISHFTKTLNEWR
jgi:hypothetical protein